MYMYMESSVPHTHTQKITFGSIKFTFKKEK